MRLIDADALLYVLETVPLTDDGGVDINDLEDIINRLPTIDAVPVIRCKDCKYSVDYYNDGDCYCRRPGREMQWISEKWDFFCKAGRRSDGTD